MNAREERASHRLLCDGSSCREYFGHADRLFIMEYLSLDVGKFDCVMINNSYSSWFWLVNKLMLRWRGNACQHRQQKGTAAQGTPDLPHQSQLPMRVAT